MSILDKLKDLVAKIEKGTPEETEELQREAEEILSSVGSSSVEENEEKEEIEELPDYLECTREETAQVLAASHAITLVKLELSNLLLQFEQDKKQAFSKIAERERAFLESLNQLRIKHGIPDSGYTASVPDDADSLVTFSKN